MYTLDKSVPYIEEIFFETSDLSNTLTPKLSDVIIEHSLITN